MKNTIGFHLGLSIGNSLESPLFFFFSLPVVHCISFGLQFLPDHRGTTGAAAPDTASLDPIRPRRALSRGLHLARKIVLFN